MKLVMINNKNNIISMNKFKIFSLAFLASVSFGNAQDIVKVMTDVFEIHKETQEVLYLIALNLKSKPLAEYS